ncbi:branched-chain amino acid ABC transporter permease, partial [Rhizobiaceae bacterium]|nr:branched-chain amino acid ABC transporter permease [Rhizobiaceae bacterium]
MSLWLRAVLGFGAVALMFTWVWVEQSPSLMLAILNLAIISAVMALGVNIQWGYAGLFNVGIMGFAALGGVAAVLVSRPPVMSAVAAGGTGLLAALAIFLALIALLVVLAKWLRPGWRRTIVLAVVVLGGLYLLRQFYDPAVIAIEADDPASSGFLGGLGLPILFSWLVGGAFAAGVAWLIGKVALGLRSDYLAIATLGISEIIIAMIKNEDWLTRGVKNVTGLPRPVPFETDLQQAPWFIEAVQSLYANRILRLPDEDQADALRDAVIEASSIFVKLAYTGLFASVLLIVLLLCVLALASPWGRMVRAIRDNEVSAAAMGKNVTKRHLQIFVVGSAVVGIAGAMLTTLDGQFTPGSYQPLRFTFLIWVMVIVGGSGNNLGAVLGAFLIWFLWVEVEPLGQWLMVNATEWMPAGDPLREHLRDSAQYMRLLTMG